MSHAEKLDRTAWEILNATADDCENLEQIYRQVCFELLPGDGPAAYVYRPVKGAPPLSELAAQVGSLVARGLLTPVMDDEGRPLPVGNDPSCVWRVWFQMTPQGRQAWEASDYTVEQEQTQ